MLILTAKRSKTPLVVSMIVSVFILVGAVVIFNYSNTYGAAPVGWNAGRIIDDSVFTNKNTMNVSQIQSFLNSKVPTCDTNGQQLSEYGGPDLNSDGKVQRWEWGKQYYSQTTFPCLKDYTEGGKKAAQIIYDTAQEFSINPQVLIVLLQKEQALVTDTWPLNLQYRAATGYGCPDTAACDSQYYGLTNQIRWAATMYRAIMNASPTWYTPYILGNNYIQYNPSSSCGGSTVNIQNRATQALYNYTPYQPNKGALDAGWGQAPCGAYGNRNFFLYFSNWFGQPNASATYGYSIVSQQAYSDANYQTLVGSTPVNVTPGGEVYLKVVVKNTGNQVWYKDFLRLGTENPKDRSSIFSNDSWPSGGRAALPQEDSIPAGGTATFLFKATAPLYLGDYTESFGVLLEYQRWLPGSFDFLFKVASPDPYYMVNTTDISVYSDQARTRKLDLSKIVMYPGSKIYTTLKVKNNSNRALPAVATKLATSNPKDRTSLFSDSSWLSSSNRVTSAIEGDVAPNSTSTYEFSMTAPSTPGDYVETFGIVIDGDRWISLNIMSLNISLLARPPSILTSGQILPIGSSLLSADERYRLSFQSDGNLVLYSSNRALWASWTIGKGGTQLIMQGDGNLVMYDASGKAIWHTRTMGNGSSQLNMQSDGNLVLYTSDSAPTWNTRTNGKE